MTSPQHFLRLAYCLDPEPVNGYVMARCEALDLVSQGRTEEEARATLRDEAALVLGQTQHMGSLAALLERIGASVLGKPSAGFDFDLTRLP
jgi:predicted RNase H-like HicB family nuclease